MNTQVRPAPSALKLGVVSTACFALAGVGQLGGWMVARLSPLSLNTPEVATVASPPLRSAPVDPRTAQLLNAAQPVVSGLVPARPFLLTGDAGNRARALTCLTEAVYYEAASESAQGQRAVAQVVLNRMRNPVFPHSVCGVVYQGANLDTGCQFSFVCDGSMNRPHVAWAWAAAETVARGALSGQVEPAVGEATHYHADYVAPYWAPTVAKVAQIGAHIFYRWAGDLGLPQAFSARYSAVEVVPVVKLHAPRRSAAAPRLHPERDPGRADARRNGGAGAGGRARAPGARRRGLRQRSRRADGRRQPDGEDRARRSDRRRPCAGRARRSCAADLAAARAGRRRFGRALRAGGATRRLTWRAWRGRRYKPPPCRSTASATPSPATRWTA